MGKAWLSALVLVAILAISAILVRLDEDGREVEADKRDKELSKAFANLAHRLNPDVYGEFTFLPDTIVVVKPGRLLQDFGIQTGSTLLNGNDIVLDTPENLGRCMMKFQETGSLSLRWSQGSEVYSKTMKRSENSFVTEAVGHRVKVVDKSRWSGAPPSAKSD